MVNEKEKEISMQSKNAAFSIEFSCNLEMLYRLEVKTYVLSCTILKFFLYLNYVVISLTLKIICPIDSISERLISLKKTFI